MEVVMIPAKTVVHIGEIPAKLSVDTLVEAADESMSLLTGYHYAHLPELPDRLVFPSRLLELATTAAAVCHDAWSETSEFLNTTPAHDVVFDLCSHPDCQLVRAAVLTFAPREQDGVVAAHGAAHPQEPTP